MRRRIVRRLFAAVLLLIATGCSDGRPEPAEARAWFEARYPGVQVLDVSGTEDEVVARSYRFRYRVPGGAAERTVEIQFLQDGTGRWTGRPPAAARLP